MRSIVSLEQPAISPDGRHVALVVTRQEKPALVLIDTANGAQTTIARGGGVADPRWSPDGTALAYLQKSRIDGHMQVYESTFTKSPRQLTRSDSDVVDMAWRPDSRAIAFAAAVSGANPGYFEVGDNDYTATSAAPAIHLWLLRLGDNAKQLTSGAWTLPPTDSGGIFSPQFAWSRDGRYIVFTRIATTYSGQNEYSTLWSMELANKKLRKLTGHTRLELSPLFAPAGSAMLYSYARNGDYLAFNSLRLRTNTIDADLTRRFDYNVGGALWMPGGRSLLVCANNHTKADAWILSLRGAARRIPLGDLSIVCDSYMSSTFDCGIAASISASGAVAFLATTARHPRELYYATPPYSSVRALTHFNDRIARLDLGEMRQFTWRSQQGFTNYGVVTLPPHRQPGRRYPVVVNIHGGPGDSSLRSFAWDSWPRAQLIAAHGYIVFEPNYRGSDDNGNSFALAIYRDTVSGPSNDILTGLARLRALPQVDGASVGVTGWSYGGLLTSWLITQHHFWRAAVSGAAVNDESDEYALSTTNVQNRYYFGTSPYAKRSGAIYAAQSPLTYADRVTTPTLLWATTLDPVVPIPQMYTFYHALREHHVDVRFVVFPAPTHGPVDQTQQATLSRLWLQWLDRYMR